MLPAQMRRESDRRSVFERYIGEIARGCESITGADAKATYEALLARAESKTAQADQVLDDEGRVIDDVGRLAKDEDVVILDDARQSGTDEDLFGGSSAPKPKSRTARKKTKRTRRK